MANLCLVVVRKSEMHVFLVLLDASVLGIIESSRGAYTKVRQLDLTLQ
jgi:hypothetical protein